MKKVVLSYLVIAAIALSAAFTSCSKSESEDGKGEGTLTINGTSYVISEVCLCLNADGTVNTLVLSNKDGSVATVFFLNNVELTSKTYTVNEIIISFSQLGLGFDEDNVEMVVNKSGKIYDITITGKTKENENEYTLTYKGKIRAEKNLCNS